MEFKTLEGLVSTLKEFREDAEMTQDNLVEKTGLNKIAISRTENGHTVPRIETIIKYLEGTGHELTFKVEKSKKLL